MRVRSGRSNRLAAVLLLPAFLATTPTIQVCHLTPEQSAAFYRCLILGPSVAAAMQGPVHLALPTSAQQCETGSAACESGSCPLMGRCPVREQRPARAPNYCVGDPTGGFGVRSAAPHVSNPHQVVATLTPAIDITPSPAPAQATRPELRARPPTRIPEARPPVRGPPSTALTRSFLPSIV
jgi:hypothetical protein